MPPAKPFDPESPCPCGSNKSLADCCLPAINGLKPAATAEALMRSRYTAHALAAIDYLWDTWSPKQRKGSSKEAIAAWATSCEWLKLDIVETQAGQPDDHQGTVRFIAHYRQDGQTHQHHETSVFHQFARGWLYIDHKS